MTALEPAREGQRMHRRATLFALLFAACAPEGTEAPRAPVDAAVVLEDAAAPLPDAAELASDASGHPDALAVVDAALAEDAALPDAASAADAAAADAVVIDAGTLDAGTSADASASDAGAPPGPVQGPLWRAIAERGELARFTLNDVDVAADGALVMRPGAGVMATDPFGAGNYEGGNYYNGGTYRYAVAISPAIVFARPFDEVIPSFEVDTPAGTWVNVKLAARIGGVWTGDYVLGVWAYDSSTIRRHSVDGQMDADGRVATDTLILARRAEALRITVILFSEGMATPRVRAVSAVAVDRAAAPRADPPNRAVWGTVLDVPGRSQMIYPDGGQVWCSPTSMTMLLAYWSRVLSVPQLVQRVPTTATMTFDWIYDGNGNWPFNTAHGAAAAGGALHGFVTRLDSFAQLERLIAANIPVAMSISYGRGELGGSPINSTAGHLIVARGFAANGDVVCNDPAFGSDATVDVTYDRAELERAWAQSGRTIYVMYPRGSALPVDPLGAF